MSKIPNHIWRQFENRLSQKERPRLIRLGRIVPAAFMKPQMMDKVGDTWVPRVGGNI